MDGLNLDGGKQTFFYYIKEVNVAPLRPSERLECGTHGCVTLGQRRDAVAEMSRLGEGHQGCVCAGLNATNVRLKPNPQGCGVHGCATLEQRREQLSRSPYHGRFKPR